MAFHTTIASGRYLALAYFLKKIPNIRETHNVHVLLKWDLVRMGASRVEHRCAEWSMVISLLLASTGVCPLSIIGLDD
jgi:hypothetical protein